MSEDLCTDLKNWLLSLGYNGGNTSDHNTEDELKRLIPPEMRDIWRNIMSHVMPVHRCRYIRKVLLLNELKKRKGSSKIPKNVQTVKDLLTFENYEKLSRQLNKEQSYVDELKCKTNELKEKFNARTVRWKFLIEEKEDQNHKLALLQYKISSYAQSIAELNQIHDCLTRVNSFWNNSASNNTKNFSNEVMENLLEEVNNFGKRRHLLNDDKLMEEQNQLVECVNRLAANINPSDLQKIVIGLLEETLSHLLKLTIRVTAKQDSEFIVDLDREITEMRKRCVHAFIDCQIVQEKVRGLEEKVQNELLSVISMCTHDYASESDKNILKTWLDTEHLSHRMITRYKFLTKEEAKTKNGNLLLPSINFNNEKDKENFFRMVYNYQKQLVSLSQDVNRNLCYLSEKSINMFMNHQRYCKTQIQNFIEQQNAQKTEQETCVEQLRNALKKEIVVLENLQLRKLLTNRSNIAISSDNSIMEYTRNSNFLLYLKNDSDKLLECVPDLSFTSDIICDKLLKFKLEERDFLRCLSNTLTQTRNNLKNVEKEAEMCSKNMALWVDFSIDELVPPHIMVHGYTLKQWLEKYQACIYSLRK